MPFHKVISDKQKAISIIKTYLLSLISYHFRVKHGFTLVELLIAISVVSIVSSLAYANFNSAQDSARDSRRKQDLKQAGLITQLAGLIPKFGGGKTPSGPQPQVAAATSTQNLGYTTAETGSIGTSNRIRVSRITVPDAKSGIVSQGSMYIAGNTNAGTVYMVVYNDNGSLQPGNLIAVSSGISVSSTQAAGWVNFTFPTQFNISTSQNIWIGMYADITGTTGGTSGPLLYYSASVVGDYVSDGYVFINHGDAPVSNPFGIGTDSTSQRSWSAYLIVNPPTPNLLVDQVTPDKTTYTTGETMKITSMVRNS